MKREFFLLFSWGVFAWPYLLLIGAIFADTCVVPISPEIVTAINYFILGWGAATILLLGLSGIRMAL